MNLRQKIDLVRDMQKRYPVVLAGSIALYTQGVPMHADRLESCDIDLLISQRTYNEWLTTKLLDYSVIERMKTDFGLSLIRLGEAVGSLDFQFAFMKEGTKIEIAIAEESAEFKSRKLPTLMVNSVDAILEAKLRYVIDANLEIECYPTRKNDITRRIAKHIEDLASCDYLHKWMVIGKRPKFNEGFYPALEFLYSKKYFIMPDKKFLEAEAVLEKFSKLFKTFARE